MSRIGKKPIIIPSDVEISIENRIFTAKNFKGQLIFIFSNDLEISYIGDEVSISPKNKSKTSLSRWGMSRTMIYNMIYDLKNGFSKTLEINGVGYRASINGENLQLSLGFSHEIIYQIPDDISISVPRPIEIIISGINRQKVGQVASDIRKYRSPEPYKGKGIKYLYEHIVRKEGKKK